MAAEADLREAEERFHRAFADAGTGMALIGVSGEEAGRFLEVNDALCSILRAGRDALLGTSIADMTHPDDVAEAQSQVRRLVDARRPRRRVRREPRRQRRTSSSCNRS